MHSLKHRHGPAHTQRHRYFRVECHKSRSLVAELPSSPLRGGCELLYLSFRSAAFCIIGIVVLKPHQRGISLCGLGSLNRLFFSLRNHQNQERYCVCCQPLLIKSQLNECGILNLSPPDYRAHRSVDLVLPSQGSCTQTFQYVLYFNQASF